MRVHRLLGVLLLLAVVTPAAAIGGAKPPRPAAGRWNMGTDGHFKVTKNQKKIYGLTMPTCSGGRVKVLGRQRITLTSRGGYTNWIIGKSTPKTSNGVTPIKVKAVENGMKIDGTLYLIFAVAGEKRDNSGALSVPDCGYLSIEAQHA